MMSKLSLICHILLLTSAWTAAWLVPDALCTAGALLIAEHLITTGQGARANAKASPHTSAAANATTNPALRLRLWSMSTSISMLRLKTTKRVRAARGCRAKKRVPSKRVPSKRVPRKRVPSKRAPKQTLRKSTVEEIRVIFAWVPSSTSLPDFHWVYSVINTSSRNEFWQDKPGQGRTVRGMVDSVD